MIELQIDGMSCGGCAASLQRALAAQPGITHAEVDFARASAKVEGTLDRAALIALIQAQGFDAR